MSTAHEVTKLLEKALREFALPELNKEPAVKDGIFLLIEALDTDLEALEYGQSDEVGDKMAALEAAILEATELEDDEEKFDLKKAEKEDEGEDEEDDDVVAPDDDDDFPDDDEDA